jgi:Zn-dependent protease with chaperone function
LVNGEQGQHEMPEDNRPSEPFRPEQQGSSSHPPEITPRYLPSPQVGRPEGVPPELEGGTLGRVRVAYLAEFLPAINWFFWSFVVVVWASGSFGLENGTWIVVAVWLLSGAVILWPPLEAVLAKVVFRLRRPTMAEDRRLEPIWWAVARRAGINPAANTLWIQESEEISASPTAGHTVAVTRWSLYTLPPSHLEAVLAHELSHHLAGRSWVTMLAFWYSLPARAALAVVKLLFKLIKTVPVLGCLIVGFFLIAYLGVIVAMLMFHESLLTPLLYFTPLLAAPLLAWLGRWSERNADRSAAELGYGPKLIEVFYGWQVRGHDAGRPVGNLRSEMLSTHPRISERIRALEKLYPPR